jgi:outer membrane biosynthesis protein TonB
MDLKRMWMLPLIFSGCCVAASAQSDGNGSVIIHSGESATSSNDNSGIRVSSGVMAAQILNKPDPVYPPTAGRISGAVVLAVRIDKEGKVVKATAISGPEPLRDPAASAVRRWTYKPYLLNGDAIMVSTTVTVMFYPKP